MMALCALSIILADVYIDKSEAFWPLDIISSNYEYALYCIVLSSFPGVIIIDLYFKITPYHTILIHLHTAL